MSFKFWQLILLLSTATILNATICSETQYSANNGACVSCPANCTGCSSADLCTGCIKGSYLITANSHVTCLTCSQIFVGCAQCLSNVACITCRDGFFLSNSQCKSCSQNTPYCSKCSTDGASCSQCAFPFILNNGSCVGAAESIATNSSTSDSANSKGVADLIPLANGTLAAPVLDQYGCNQIQFFFNHRCIKVIEHCFDYKPNGQCLVCDEGYSISLFGDCTPINNMLNCETGYWMNTKLDKCVRVDPSCDWFYPNNGSCLNCSKNYIKDEFDQCVQNIVCDSRSFFYQGDCFAAPESCSVFTSVGTCTTCRDGYKLHNGICILSNDKESQRDCKSPCKICLENKPNFCLSCANNFELSRTQYGKCEASLD